MLGEWRVAGHTNSSLRTFVHAFFSHLPVTECVERLNYLRQCTIQELSLAQLAYVWQGTTEVSGSQVIMTSLHPHVGRP